MGFFGFLSRHVLAAVLGALGILLAGLGYYDQAVDWWPRVQPWQLQAFGALLFVIAVVRVLYDNDRAVRVPVTGPSTKSDDPHRDLRSFVAIGRSLATRYTNGEGRGQSWRHFLEGSSLYPHIRGRLSEEYMAKLTRPRTIYASGEGKIEPLVEWFLDEMDRLERESKR